MTIKEDKRNERKTFDSYARLNFVNTKDIFVPLF